ncbi:MAG: DEAD/DEAH box helicase [Chloroflexota bacterium]|nr:DEAD/DEAH box helicase [Chloroflexota bacterium]
MTNEFHALNLHPQLVQTVSELGYTSPTPIQAAVIPVMLAGQDIIGQAQTGTGKTAAFALPILNNLSPNGNSVQCLVLAPTRELAMQVAKAMHGYGRQQGVGVLPVYGGQPYGRQISRLRKGVDIVVGTPGRLLDLINKGVLDLSQVKTVVLDEADEMLSMGFIEDIEEILSATPPIRQTALFSATMPAAIRHLANRYMTDPQVISIERQQRTVDTVDQRHYLVNERDKTAALTRVFEIEPVESALIFCRTRARTGTLANELTIRGFPAEALNGDMSQDARERVLNRFRRKQIKVLVATDVAARGLDIDDISHVFNFDFPPDPEIYVHRIGRTGRAGKSGVALSLVTPSELWRMGRTERYTRQKIARAELPTIEEIQKHREKALIESIQVWLRRDRCRREREIVTELAAQGVDPIDIAAVALKMARGEEKQRPIAPIGQARKKQPKQSWRADNRAGRSKDRGRRNGSTNNGSHRKGSHEQGMVRLTLSKGRSDGLRVNHVVGTLAHFADIPGHTLGKISIQDHHTLVDVPEKLVEQVLAKSGAYRFGRYSLDIERA